VPVSQLIHNRGTTDNERPILQDSRIELTVEVAEGYGLLYDALQIKHSSDNSQARGLGLSKWRNAAVKFQEQMNLRQPTSHFIDSTARLSRF
jgi:hypothetical protein